MATFTTADPALVDCEICGESVPHVLSVLRVEAGRVCWTCYSEPTAGPSDDDDDDDWDDDDEEPDWDDDDWYDE